MWVPLGQLKNKLHRYDPDKCRCEPERGSGVGIGILYLSVKFAPLSPKGHLPSSPLRGTPFRCAIYALPRFVWLKSSGFVGVSRQPVVFFTTDYTDTIRINAGTNQIKAGERGLVSCIYL